MDGDHWVAERAKETLLTSLGHRMLVTRDCYEA